MCEKIFSVAKLFETSQNVYENKVYKIGQVELSNKNTGNLFDKYKKFDVDNLTFEIKNFVSEMEFDLLIKLYKGDNLFREDFLQFNIKTSLGIGFDTELREIIPEKDYKNKELLGTLEGKNIYLGDKIILKRRLDVEILNEYVDTIHLHFYKDSIGNLKYKGVFVRKNGQYVPKYVEYGFTDNEIESLKEGELDIRMLSPINVYLDLPSQYVRHLLSFAI